MPSLCLSEAAFARISKYAKAVKIAPEDAASKAIMKWMDSTGDDVVYELAKRRRQRAQSIKSSNRAKVRDTKAVSDSSPVPLLSSSPSALPTAI